MLRVSRMTDYAVVILGQMAQAGEAKPIGSVGRAATLAITAIELAEATTLPQPTVAKVLKRLSKTGVIRSVRGAAGGYLLEKPADQISMAEIVEAIDGPVALTACVEEAEGDCVVESLCPMRGRWDRLNAAVQTAFQTVSLAEIAAVPTVPDFINIEQPRGAVDDGIEADPHHAVAE